MKKFKVTFYETGQKFLVPANSATEIANALKGKGLGGFKIQAVKEEQMVVTTCGWGKNAHRWETTKAEAIQHRNTCPQHRS